MPPRTPQKRPIARRGGSDPTVSIATASAARTNLEQNVQTQETNQPPIHAKGEPSQTSEKKTSTSNDDLKKLIETLKNKLGSQGAPSQKQAPPKPQAKGAWNRSIANKEPNFKPAYTVLTRISNHEKVPVKTTKSSELTINSLPHSFLYRPGVDGIKVDKLNIKSGKQIGWG